jgi:hypothetical protein
MSFWLYSQLAMKGLKMRERLLGRLVMACGVVVGLVLPVAIAGKLDVFSGFLGGVLFAIGLLVAFGRG